MRLEVCTRSWDPGKGDRVDPQELCRQADLAPPGLLGSLDWGRVADADRGLAEPATPVAKPLAGGQLRAPD